MLRGYPNRAAAGKSYIGAIAELLTRYPKHVALGAADPFKGVARETTFLPTPADIIGWCEKQCSPLYEEAARERRVSEQLAAREAWHGEAKDPAMLEKTQAWLDRSDPKAAQLSGVSDADAHARKADATAYTMEANRRLFERECAASGIDPAANVSPTLRKMVGAL